MLNFTRRQLWALDVAVTLVVAVIITLDQLFGMLAIGKLAFLVGFVLAGAVTSVFWYNPSRWQIYPISLSGTFIAAIALANKLFFALDLWIVLNVGLLAIIAIGCHGESKGETRLRLFTSFGSIAPFLLILLHGGKSSLVGAWLMIVALFLLKLFVVIPRTGRVLPSMMAVST